MALFFCHKIFLMKFICIDFNSFSLVLDLESNDRNGISKNTFQHIHFYAYGHFLYLLILCTVCFCDILYNLHKDKFVRPYGVRICEKAQAPYHRISHSGSIPCTFPVRNSFLLSYPCYKLIVSFLLDLI